MNYEKNLKLISIKYPHLLTELSGTAINNGINLEISRSRTGRPVARLTKGGRRVFLNSAYDPELEAERWAERRAGKEKGALILCGGGFLYHLKAILKLGQYKRVVCYEPEPAILKACLQEVDLSDLKGDFLLLAGANYHECANLISQYLMYLMLDSDWAMLPPYQELFPGEIELFQNALRESVRITRANLTTASLFGEQWLSNAVKNLRTIASSPGVKHFFNQFTGVPAVVVSAGPSLEKNVHLLNEIREKAVIICAGTSIRAMLKFGVTPHFLVAFDGGHYNKTIYADLDLNEICLIYNYRFNHEALAYFGGKKAYMKLDTETFSDFLSLKCGGYDFGTVRSGFSVAHPSLDLAVKFGCSPVILIGQDLAYTGDKRYAESLYQQVVDKNQLPPNCFITKDLYGREIVTDRQLDSFRLLFELMVREYYQGKVILNATEGGQPIQGVPNRKLADVIDEYCRQEWGVSRRIAELHDAGLKELQRLLPRGFDIVAQLRNISGQGIIKMEALADRIRQLRHLSFTPGALLSELESSINRIAAEYEAVINAKDWQLLLKDLKDWKISPNLVAIAGLGVIRDKEAYDHKLKHWMNIVEETQKYLEYISEQLADAAKTENGSIGTPSLIQIAGVESPGKIMERIRNGQNLKAIQADLETIINQGDRKDLNQFRYLYGLVLFKQGQIQKAILALEQIRKRNDADAKTNFLLYRCYRKLQNFTKTQECLEDCVRLGTKPDYCRRMLVKNAYRAKNYVAVNNWIIEYQNSLPRNCFYPCLRVDCLVAMKLFAEAEEESRRIIGNFRVRGRVGKWLTQLATGREENELERCYRNNEDFFNKKGIPLGSYAEARLKSCSYLGDEYIYDTGSKRFLLAVNQIKTEKLEIAVNDTLLVCDTDDVHLYQRLARIYEDSAPEERKSLAMLPVFIIEHQPENWQLLMQKFDFNRLAEWQNLHFLIGIKNEALEGVFLNDAAPLPTTLYGTGLDEIKQLLDKVGRLKEVSYQERLAELREYYQQLKPAKPNKILVVTSIADELLLYYGRALQKHLKEQGYDCELVHEKAPYYKFNKYSDAKLLNSLRPDLIIHLFATAEELEAYQSLNISFISWRLTERWLAPGFLASCPNERILVAGDPNANSNFLNRGFAPEQIKSVPIPYLPVITEVKPGIGKKVEIAVVADLNDYERILENLAGIVESTPGAGIDLSREELIGVCRNLYFNLLTEWQNRNSLVITDDDYQRIILEVFAGKNRAIKPDLINLIMAFLRRELEDSLSTLAQVKWLVKDGHNYRLELYGSNWQNDFTLKRYHQGTFQLFGEEHQRVILNSKINLYPKCLLKNDTYWQPDLINGIAMGGFFLVNDTLVKAHGEKILEPFAGMLETYGTREELLAKVDYFLKNESEREERAGKLQQHIRDNFGIDKTARIILDVYQEMVHNE